MTRGPLADGGSLQTARISGRPCEYGGGGETTAKFPLRNFFGCPGFIGLVWSVLEVQIPVELLLLGNLACLPGSCRWWQVA